MLIVDDDTHVAAVYAAYARVRGHSPIVAHDGASGLLLAALERPDVIMLDVSMPRLDGRDVCSVLQTDARTSGVPVVAVTARGDEQGLRSEMLGLGAWEVFAKPVDLWRLFDWIARVVAVSRVGPA